MGIANIQLTDPVKANVKMHVQTQGTFNQVDQRKACAGIFFFDLTKEWSVTQDQLEESLLQLKREERCDENFRLLAYGVHLDEDEDR